MLFKKTPVITPAMVPAPEPTLEERLADANIAASVHLSAFVRAADGLDKAANDLDAVRDTAAEEASRHDALKIKADELAFRNRQQAQKIRDLLL